MFENLERVAFFAAMGTAILGLASAVSVARAVRPEGRSSEGARSQENSVLRRESASVVVLVEAMTIFLVVVSLIQFDLNMLVWSMAAAVAIPAWFLAFHVPALCGVNTMHGRPCMNMTKGLIFGCGRANHTWAKFFARFGWRTQPIPEPSEPAPDGVATTAPGVGQVRIAEPRRNAITFWLALVSTVIGLVSAAIDVTTIR